jgi:hypothetical protein
LDWLYEQQKEGVGFEQVLQPQQADFKRLCRLSLLFVSSLLKAESEGKLPTVKEAKELLESLRHFQWKDPIPDNFSSRVVDTEEQPVLVRREENEKSHTHIDANNAKIGIPMQRDLNKKETVQCCWHFKTIRSMG